MSDDSGRLPSAPGYSAEPEPVPVSALLASIPSAIIGFTGTRSPLTLRQKNTLADAMLGFREAGAVWMHNGDCVNADAFAGQYWRAIGGKLELHPPEVSDLRAFLTADAARSPRPYLVRNYNIVGASTALLAAPSERVEKVRSGTWSTVRCARRAGMPVMIVFPDGSFATERWPAQAIEARSGETRQGLDADRHESAVPKASPRRMSHDRP